MKTIIAISHVANKGKTNTLREFAHLILIKFPAYQAIFPQPALVPTTGEFRLVINVNNHIIGIESQGDPKTDLGERLLELADNYQCDVILCSTRTSGETVDAVDHLFSNRGFETIWTSTYQMADPAIQTTVNQVKATHLLDLLLRLGRI